MSFYHVRLSIVDEASDEVKNDLTDQQLEDQFLVPYRAGTSITVNGRWVPIGQVQRLRVSVSDVPAASLIQDLSARDHTSGILVIGGPSLSWRAAASARDVTDDFIKGTPGSGKEVPLMPAASGSPVPTGNKTSSSDKKSVFLVHGRDLLVAKALKDLLRALGLRIVEWEHAVTETGVPNPYVGDVVVAGLAMADAVVVLLTPDETVTLRPDLLLDSDGLVESTPQGQARPNVFYEAGIADTLGRGRTVLVEVGPVKPFSDVAGRLTVRYSGSGESRNRLAARLRSAGLEVDTSADDWMSAGDLSEALKPDRLKPNAT